MTTWPRDTARRSWPWGRGDGACGWGFAQVGEAGWSGLVHKGGVPWCSTHPSAACSVLEAGDGHHVGPVIRLHEDTSGMCAGHMEGRGAVLIGALDAGTRHPLHALAAVHTFLHRMGCRVTSKAREVSSRTGGGGSHLNPNCQFSDLFPDHVPTLPAAQSWGIVSPGAAP